LRSFRFVTMHAFDGQTAMQSVKMKKGSERVVNRWNKLPASVLEATSDSFKAYRYVARLQKVRTTEIGLVSDEPQTDRTA